MEEFFLNLRNNHDDFNQGELDDHVGKINPLLLFQKWYKEAYERNCSEPHAMVVSTVDESGQPSSRVVYMKEFLEEGVVFYTNYNSKKGREIVNNPKVSLLFYWDCLERQVRIHGHAEKAPSELSDDYFASRPRASQIGAWASNQSDAIISREALEKNYRYWEEQFENKAVPRPPHWGGILIVPNYFEFWQGRPSRLHDRICFTKNDGDNIVWSVERKNP